MASKTSYQISHVTINYKGVLGRESWFTGNSWIGIVRFSHTSLALRLAEIRRNCHTKNSPALYLKIKRLPFCWHRTESGFVKNTLVKQASFLNWNTERSRFRLHWATGELEATEISAYKSLWRVRIDAFEHILYTLKLTLHAYKLMESFTGAKKNSFSSVGNY